MALISYRPKVFSAAHLKVIEQATAIAETYRRQGYNLTLRQLYYQFVARGLISNRDTEYKRLGSILNDARVAGEFDWDYITDRTRNVRGGDGAMTDPAEVIEPLAYAMALWEGQSERVEVWVEKDALVEVVGRAASRYRAAYFSCRGYTSVSELHVAAERIEGYLDEEGVEQVTILHLGDHDPSGIDMTRDITDRLTMFLEGDGYDPYGQLAIDRIALNMDQVRQYNPPPNPAKLTDSRAVDYIRTHGDESWELDALDPTVLNALIVQRIDGLVDHGLWNDRLGEQQKGRATLTAAQEHWPSVATFLAEQGWISEEADDADDAK